MKSIKTCTKCKQEKIIIEFSKDKSKTDGISSHCKECVKTYKSKNKERTSEYNRNYQKENKTKIHLQSTEYYKINKDNINSNKKEYRKLNSSYISTYNKAYYNQNADKILNQKKTYRESNRELYLFKLKSYQKTDKFKISHRNIQHKRRSITKQGDVTTRQLLELEQNAKVCYWCNVSLKKVKIHIDHYIPLSKGGLHTVSNLVVSCPKCNQSKCAKDPLKFANSIGRLL